MDGAEELSGDFEWRVEALATESGFDLETLLGTHATGTRRHWRVPRNRQYGWDDYNL